MQPINSVLNSYPLDLASSKAHLLGYSAYLKDTHQNEHTFDKKSLIPTFPLIQYLESHLPCVVAILDYKTWQYPYLSKSYESLLGRPQEVMLDKGLEYLLSIQHPSDSEQIANEIFGKQLAFLRSVSTDQQANYRLTYNYRILHANGSYIHILQHTTVLESDTMGNPLVVMIVAQDISNFKTDNKIYSSISQKEKNSSFIPILTDIYSPPDDTLSKRELEVLRLLAKGHNSQSVASLLNRSLHTIKTHRKNMLEKTGMRNTVELIRYSITNGLL